MHPNEQQLPILRAIVERCRVEAEEELDDRADTSTDEPLRAMIQGLPGVGKSELIKWVRALFEEVLGWTHGVEFVCLASQNTMAALIGGRTFHSWAGLLVNDTATKSKKAQVWAKPDANPMYERTRMLRWILVDEGSTASAEVMAATNSTLSTSIRAKNTYLRRPNGTKRPMGGMNFLFFVDWWQLPPVNATALSSNPLRTSTSAN